MNNPICNTQFDSRDLIEYRDYLATELTDRWNDFEGTADHQANDINDILGTSGYEYADDIKEVYQAFTDEAEDDITEYNKIDIFISELENYGDFKYGTAIIHDDYFTDYTEEFLKELGYIPVDFPSWIELDFEATAENVKTDYTSADYDGDTYYIRA